MLLGERCRRHYGHSSVMRSFASSHWSFPSSSTRTLTGTGEAGAISHSHALALGLLASVLRLREPMLEIVQPPHELRDVGHDLFFVIDSRSLVKSEVARAVKFLRREGSMRACARRSCATPASRSALDGLLRSRAIRSSERIRSYAIWPQRAATRSVERLWSGRSVKDKSVPHAAGTPFIEVLCSWPKVPSASWLQSTIRGGPQEGFRRRVAARLHSLTRARGSSFRARFPPDSRLLDSSTRSEAASGEGRALRWRGLRSARASPGSRSFRRAAS